MFHPEFIEKRKKNQQQQHNAIEISVELNSQFTKACNGASIHFHNKTSLTFTSNDCSHDCNLFNMST